MDIEEDVDDPMEIDDTVQDSQIIENKTLSPEKEASSDKVVTSEKESSAIDVVVLDDDDDSDYKVDSNYEKDLIKAMEPEVIDLVPHSIGGVCINYACKSGKDMLEAPGFCLSYFRVKSCNKKIKKVCSECYNIAVKMYDDLVGQLKSGSLLFNADVPLLNDMVEIEDSDEEKEEEEIKEVEYLDENNFNFIKNNIDDVINEVMIKFKIRVQAKKEADFMKERLVKTNEMCKELSANLKAMRKQVDALQINFYKEFKPEVRESCTFAIIDDFLISPDLILKDGASGNNIPSNVINLEPSRKSSRRIVKPISYAEIDDGVNSNSPKPTPAGEPIDVDKENVAQNENTQGEPPDLPPIGPVEKPNLKINEAYYISRENNTGCWVRARLTNMLYSGTIHDGQKMINTMYKFTQLKQLKERFVNGKNIAYINGCPTRLEVGARVIAVLKETVITGETKKSRTASYYPGIVAEPPYAQNNYRYLIFFDIGHSQYVHHSMVNLIYEVSKTVWDDMPSDSRPFIKKHIESQDWPMVKLKKDQSIVTEYNGKWLYCTVINVDCSLVQVFFEDLNRFEWIYRGSRRIKEIFREEQAAINRTAGQRATRKVGQNESKNIVQYTPNVNFTQSSLETIDQEQTQSSVRAVARKSTAKPEKVQAAPVTSVPFLPPVNNNLVNASGPVSKIMYFTPRDQHTMKRPYRPHICSPKCKDFLTHNYSKLRGQNPLSKPLLCGWARMTIKVRGRKDIAYKAPCGRLLRNIAEVHFYLTQTHSEMTVDLFDFNHMVRCLAEFSVDCDPDPKDLSKGLEQVPIPVINGINNEMLDFCNYSTKRVPMEGVTMNLDPDFMACCDCEDDCIDKTTCSCWTLTLEGARFFEKDCEPNAIGYIYRRLPEQVVTGIYECNSRCKCNMTCLNRVAQHPMSLKLQVFRTHNRGWGIRCLNDVPQGAFICVYAGTIHTDQRANEDGKTYGDEYFAELDYIESVEKYKEDYEKEAVLDEDDLIPEKPPPSPPEEEMDVDEPTKLFPGAKKRYMDDNDFVLPVSLTSTERESRVQTRLRRRAPSDVKTDETKPVAHQPDGGEIKTDAEIKKEPPSRSTINAQINTLTSDIDTVTISDDEEDIREVLSFNPKNATDLDEKSNYTSVRDLYGADESIYIMDAKNAGNIGRFLNHSCSPNVFVQNVFVDTHDPRFPWVAFFASQFIRAGTELTWNYSYDIGSVPGKVLYCHCAALECKGRLL